MGRRPHKPGEPEYFQTREPLPANVWRRAPQTAADLEHGAIYRLEPEDVLVYVSLTNEGTWVFTGDSHKFFVEDDLAIEISADGRARPRPLDAFKPEGTFISRCTAHGVINDWEHQELCEDFS
jgi:hypothetical protein